MNFSEIKGAKVLVIGASSFIGANLVPKLLELGAEVYGTTFNKTASNLNYRSLDVRDISAVQRLIQDIRPDYVYNLSGYVKGSRVIEHIWPTFKVNLEGTVNLLSVLHRYPCKRMVIMGSLDEYQANSNKIIPVSPYAASKIAANAYARMFHALYDFPVVITRPFMAYGIKQKDHNKLVPYTILSLLKGEIPKFTSGTREADWVFISDVVDGLIRAALCPGIEGQSLQFGIGELHSVKEVVTHIFKMLNASELPQFSSLADRKLETIIVADIHQTKALIGWEPKVGFIEGIQKTVDWYKERFEKGQL